MMIFKIFTADQWKVLDDEGETIGAPIDVADGFIHFSKEEQVAGTLALYFAGQEGLILAAVDTDALSSTSLQWDISRNGEQFPHLYAKLNRTNVIWFETLALDQDRKHILPAQMKE